MLNFIGVRFKYSLSHIKQGFECYFCCRTCCSTVKPSILSKIRNIGIIAHIDAGKTTTTERMLYYSGITSMMGEVHEGNTVMDYMDLERKRGITISSAAITFPWKKHRINLIDTPGHVDFTFEVERVLAALEGAVVILDASAGVEVQTLKVWNQAERYQVPCIVYLNKMDKPAADLGLCLDSLSKKLKIKPLLLHLPIRTGKHFVGVVDILRNQKILWNDQTDNGDGSNYVNENLCEEDKELSHEATLLREKLVETILDLDELIAEKFLLEGIDSLKDEDLQSALHRITLKRSAVPVLCGSSYKNTGVQLLMDAILQYLPSPDERYYPFITNSDDVCAFVFKITHNKAKEPLTFLRVYSGTLKSGQRIHNINSDATEKISKISIAYANNFKDIPAVTSGNIAVVSGLKNAVTGDFIFSSTSSLNKTKDVLKNLNYSIQVPNPVFFCSIEPQSVGFQKELDIALQCLQREDPTFHVELDEAQGQTILSGMGELHIEIIKQRIKLDYGLDAYLGPLLVAYRETVENKVTHIHILDKTIRGCKHFIKLQLRIYPDKAQESLTNVNVIVTKDNDLGKIRSDYLKSINAGIRNALNNGPFLQFPVIRVGIDLLWLEVSKSSSHAMISAAASQCVAAALKQASIYLLEPVMKLSIIVDKGYAGRVLNDLSQKRSQILSMESRQDIEIIETKTPLSELRGYSTILRALTAGTCSFTMEFDSYEKLDSREQTKAVEELTGLAPS